MNLAPFTGPGSTPARRRFWNDAFAAVMASRKIAGRNVGVSEHQGQGTVINCDRSRSSSVSDCGDCHVTMCPCIDNSYDDEGGHHDVSSFLTLSGGDWQCSRTLSDSGSGYYRGIQQGVTIHDFLTSDCTGEDSGGSSVSGVIRLYPNGDNWDLIEFWHYLGVGVGFYASLTSGELDNAVTHSLPICNQIVDCDQPPPWPPELETLLKTEFGLSSMFIVATEGSMVISLP